MGESINASIKRLISQYNIPPKQSLGQNFLIDENIYKKILKAADVSKNDCIFEIGAGLGTLTKLLCERARYVVTIETDKKLLPLLRQELSGFSNYTLIPGSALELSFQEIWKEAPNDCSQRKLVANIPYYITGKIMRAFLPDESITTIVLLVQSEVAERMKASPGDMSMLSLTAQWYADITVVSHVSRNCFFPSPKVDSSIIHLQRHGRNKKLLPDGITEKDIFRFARYAFNQKRKQIANSLAAGMQIASSKVADQLHSVDISPKSRPQDLKITDWITLTDLFSK